MQVKYISDLHLYDSYSMDWRPNYQDMNSYADDLVTQWNMFTEEDDLVIIVGDVGKNCPRTVEILSMLKGIKVLVVGNHDLVWGKYLYSCGIFGGIHNCISRNNIFISHKPDEYRGECQFYIHGHHHRYDMPGMNKALQLYMHDTCRLNCAADLTNNKPCTIQELILNKELLMERYKVLGLLGGN